MPLSCSAEARESNVEKVGRHFEVNVCNRLGETTALTFVGAKEEIGKFDLMSIRFV